MQLADAQDLADSLGMECIETSAKSAENVKEAFLKMTRKMLEQTTVTPGHSAPSPSNRLTERKKVKKGCCS